MPITFTVRACRDPKDDKFLELAINGRADLIVTGDEAALRMARLTRRWAGPTIAGDSPSPTPAAS